MNTLTEYVEADALRELVSMFSAAAGAPVRIVAPDGHVLAGAPDGGPNDARASVVVGENHLGTILLSDRSGRPGAESVRLLGLMRDVLTRLCEQAEQLRQRVEELAAVYRLTEVFTGQTDLNQVHRLVAETMVKVTGTDACSIRVLSEDGSELLTAGAYGLSADYLAKGAVPLSQSQIDREVFSTGNLVYVADEQADARVLYQAEARREGLVSALCAPMVYRGKVEGVIRVYTRAQHEFDWFETSLIRGVASQAAGAVVNARLHHEALQAENVRQQMRIAGEVQRRMVPVRPPTVPGLDIATRFVPCFEVGGDFYDFIELPGGNLGVGVGDVSGKGIGASLLMASARSALRAHAVHQYELALVLAAVNVHMWRDGRGSDFVTLFYGVADVPNQRFTYCNAGHEPALLIREGQVRPLSAGGGVLGMDPTLQYAHEAIDLRPGDALVIFTDGLTEAVNFRDEPFGRSRARAAALSAWQRGEPAEGICNAVLWEMRRFTGLQTRWDDLTLVTIRVQ